MTGEAAAPRPFRLNYGFGSHRGLRRQLNEDSLVVTGNLFAVADGMGGHEAGEVASRICVETLAAGVKEVQDDLTAEDLQHLMVRADEAIREASGARAGTTLAGVAIVREHQGLYWMVFNVGDSRVYRLSEDEFSQVSVDLRCRRWWTAGTSPRPRPSTTLGAMSSRVPWAPGRPRTRTSGCSRCMTGTA